MTSSFKVLMKSRKFFIFEFWSTSKREVFLCDNIEKYFLVEEIRKQMKKQKQKQNIKDCHDDMTMIIMDY